MISRSDVPAVAGVLVELMLEQVAQRQRVIAIALEATELLQTRGPLATQREAAAIRELVAKPRDTASMEAGVLAVARAALVDALEARERSFN